MTISTTVNRKQYSGNGVTTIFSFPYRFFADTDVVVAVVNDSTGAVTTQVLSTDYTITGAGGSSGGNVTMVTAPATGESLVIYRNVPLTQETDYISGDPFPAETHENALDRAMVVAQQLNDLIQRSFQLSITDTSGASTTIPNPNAGYLLGWNEAGDALTNIQEIGSYKGTDATTTTAAYIPRDLVKSSTTAQLNNLYMCIQDSPAGTLLTNTSYWVLLVDAVAAATSATSAASSASSASTSATSAASSASSASSSASAAATSETNAATSETNAAASASAAATSETNAATSETNAATSETNAAASASAAATSETNAAASATAAQVAKIEWQGTYSAATAYALNDAVTYNGSSFICIQAGTGNTPAVGGTAYWDDLAVKGTDGTGDLLSTNNLSDLANAATARTNLGLAIGVNVQAYDVDTLKADVADTLTAPFRGAVTTDNDMSFSMAAGNNFTCTVAANGTLTFTNITAGQSGNIYVNNSGGYAISAAATTLISSADLTKLSTAGAYWVSYYSADGTNVSVAVSPALTAAGA